MSEPPPPLDDLLQACEREPIHIPGAIQPHGVLLFADSDDIVRVHSADLGLLGLRRPVLGRPAREVLGATLTTALAHVAVGEPVTAMLAGGTLVDAVAQHLDDGLLIELERPSEVDVHERTALARVLRRLQQAVTSDELLDQTVLAVRDLTGFDRVMAYQFDADWNGTVVAEAVEPGLGAFLGLRYPASDIPPQARALYLRNRVRVIPAVDLDPVPLLTDPGRPSAPLDLSDSTLRAVSPVHLEYLENMGVLASASIALVVGGELWGLIACHHSAGSRRPSQRVRITLDVLSGTSSALLGGLRATEAATTRIELISQLDALATPLLDEHAGDLVHQLDPSGVLTLLDADAATLTTHGAPALSVGDGPPDVAVRELVRWMGERQMTELATSGLAEELPEGAEWSGLLEHVAGVVAVRWGGEDEWLVWMRREQVRAVRWGGDPAHKEVVLEPEGARLGPRTSFEEYVETVQGTCRPWGAEHLDIARQLGRRLQMAAARRGRRDRSVAALMQRALLLDSVPPVPGADIAALYRPARGEGLGGDWYDVFFLPDGRAVVALGDVAGHGMEVAAPMAQIRHALRAYVLGEPDLVSAMARLNDLSCSLLPGEMATLVVALLDPRRRTLDVVNAGHLPPVVATPSGVAGFASLARNPALGLARSIEFVASTVALEHGGSLVLYTDGLVERRRIPLDDQLGRLVETVARHERSTSRDLCDHLDATFAPDGSDDVTVLVLGFPAEA